VSTANLPRRRKAATGNWPIIAPTSVEAATGASEETEEEAPAGVEQASAEAAQPTVPVARRRAVKTRRSVASTPDGATAPASSPRADPMTKATQESEESTYSNLSAKNYGHSDPNFHQRPHDFTSLDDVSREVKDRSGVSRNAFPGLRDFSPLTGAPLSVARQALVSADAQRAEHLLAVAEGTLSVEDVIEAACSEAGRPLRRIGLRQLYLAQPGWGAARVEALLGALAKRTAHEGHLRELDISWLIDPRQYGRRYLTLIDLRCTRRGAPWNGFPFTPAPHSITRPRPAAADAMAPDPITKDQTR
jgi:hypothetical protein